MKFLIKTILILIILSLISFITFSVYYLSHVNFGPEVKILLPHDNKVKIKAIAPTGGIINLDYDTIQNCYFNKGRFYSSLLISGDTSNLNIKLEIGETIISIRSSELVKGTDGCLYIGKHLYPRYSLSDKLKDIKEIDFYRQFFFRFSQFLAVFLKYSVLIGFFGSLISLIALMIIKFKLFKLKISEYLKRIKHFIKLNKFKLILPLIFSLIPGSIYLFFDHNVLGFLNCTPFEFILMTSALLFPFGFAIYFSGALKLNRWFWISFASIFIITYFILFPNIYIYGMGYRDDISKFFVKAFQHNFFNDLFIPNSGYLNVLQSIIPFVILKILGIRQYLPEAIQFITLIFSSLLFASFNLKTFRSILPDDKKRFLISLILGLTKMALPIMLFMYELPFIAAILLWLLLFRMKDFSTKGFVFIVLIFVIFILSKPIFFIFAPIFFVLFIIGFKRKNIRYIISSAIWLIAILIQIMIYKGNPVITVNELTAGDLGTNIISDFRTESISLFSNIFIGAYVYVRIAYALLIPYFAEGWQQIFINVLLFILMLFINIYLLLRYIKYRKQLDLFFITGNILAVISSFLFVRTVSLPYLSVDSQTLLQMNIGELFKSNYLLTYHRYLVLGFLPVAFSLVYVFSILLKPVLKKYTLSVVSLFIFFLIINRYVSYKTDLDRITSSDNYKTIFTNIPTKNIWQQYSNLVFNYPDAYYIPYYGYPVQSECIRNGIDRITDTKVNRSGSINIDSLPYNTQKWKIIELITEYDSSLAFKISGVIAITKQNDSVFVKPFNPVNSDYRFIIFRFDRFIMPKKITFVDKDNNKLMLSKTIRLVGKYE